VCVCVCVCEREREREREGDSYRVQRVLDLPELEIQVVINHSVWMLGIEPGSSEGIVQTLNCC